MLVPVLGLRFIDKYSSRVRTFNNSKKKSVIKCNFENTSLFLSAIIFAREWLLTNQV